MEPSAEYVETRLGGRRTYRLYPDRLSFKSKGIFLPDMEIEFPLADLSPTPTKVVLPAVNLDLGLGMFVFMGVVASWLGYSCRSELFHDPFLTFVVVGFAAAAVAGLGLMVRSRLKITYLHFHSASGLACDLGQRGKFKGQFDGFVAALVAQIEKVRRNQTLAPPAGG